MTDNNEGWIDVQTMLPPHNKVVMTKVDHGGVVTNQQELKRQNRLYFLPDGSMYVYYTPTHWKPSPPRTKE